jgi:hypothetical protein
MASDSNVSIPAGGGFEVSGALRKVFQAFVLVNLDVKVKLGDF